jgi:hypothetical protein
MDGDVLLVDIHGSLTRHYRYGCNNLNGSDPTL